MEIYSNEPRGNTLNSFFIGNHVLPSKTGYLKNSSVSSVAQSCLTLHDSTDCGSRLPCPTNSWSLLRLIYRGSVIPSNHLILCCPLLLLPSIFPSIRVFQWINSLHQVAKVLEFQLQHQSFQWIFRTYFLWEGLVGSPCRPKDSQESFQHHSSKASILQYSIFFIIQLSHPYMTTGKTIVLTRWTFVGKVMSLLFNMLSRLVIGFLPRSKCLLNSWLQSPSAVILEPPKYSLSLFPLFSHLFTMKWWYRMSWSSFSQCWALSQLFHSSLSLSSRGSLVFLHFLS